MKVIKQCQADRPTDRGIHRVESRELIFLPTFEKREAIFRSKTLSRQRLALYMRRPVTFFQEYFTLRTWVETRRE